jgi:hypothetical protein
MSVVESSEQKREMATSLMIIGWICWGFALLVTFFSPAAIRLGRLGIVYTAVALAVAGLVLNIIGYRLCSRARLPGTRS